MKKLIILSLILSAGLVVNAQYRNTKRSYSPRSNVSSSFKMGNYSQTIYKNGTTRTTFKLGNTTYYDYSNGTRGHVIKSGNSLYYNFDKPRKSSYKY